MLIKSDNQKSVIIPTAEEIDDTITKFNELVSGENCEEMLHTRAMFLKHKDLICSDCRKPYQLKTLNRKIKKSIYFTCGCLGLRSSALKGTPFERTKLRLGKLAEIAILNKPTFSNIKRKFDLSNDSAKKIMHTLKEVGALSKNKNIKLAKDIALIEEERDIVLSLLNKYYSTQINEAKIDSLLGSKSS